jgi:chorismate mutase/prephenate dehydrogenase
MGHWMSRYLDMVGYHVDICDPATSDSPYTRVADWRSGLDAYEVVVVAVPLRPSNTILQQLAELQPPGLVFDIGSLKSPMRQGLQAMQDAGCRVCSVHPMFGPNEVGLSGRHILFVDVGNAAALAEARALFAHTAAECVNLSLEEHDEVMAWVLGLSHLVNITFATALAESGEEVPLLQNISSSTFNAQLRVAAQVVSENPHMYYEIQQGNDRTPDVVRRFRSTLDRLAAAVAGGDEDQFVAAMQLAHRRLSSGRT